MFDLDYDLLPYDVTSTYFEGEARGNPQTQRGYSRDGRPDCKQVCIGLVVSRCGLPLGYEIFAGNRHEKEEALHERLAQRIREGIEKTAQACQRRKQDPLAIAQRVGRLKGLNSRAAGLFQVKTQTRPDGGATATWRELDDWRAWSELSEGCYLLRTNIDDWGAEDLWRTYIQLTEAEAAFRIHKSDLRIRPIWHQKPQRVQAHIFVSFRACVLWKTLAQRCRQAGLGDEPRKVLDELQRLGLQLPQRLEIHKM